MTNLLSILLEVSNENINNSLQILWKGIVAIAIVLVIVFAFTKIMTVISHRIEDKKKKKAEDAAAQEKPDERQE